MNDIAIGFLVAIVSGLILAICAYEWNRYRRDEERRNQIWHISTLVKKYRRPILRLEEYWHDGDFDELGGILKLRENSYNGFKIELESTLLYGASQLTPYEKKQLHNIFLGDYEILLQRGINEKWYANAFKKAEKLRWLSIAPMDAENNSR